MAVLAPLGPDSHLQNSRYLDPVFRSIDPQHPKSGGFRTLIVFRKGLRAIFVHGFAKSEKDNIEKDNIEKDELTALKKTRRRVIRLR